MTPKITFCVCGGGSLAHTIACILGANPNVRTNVLTRHPKRWKQQLTLEYLDKAVMYGTIDRISDQPDEVIYGSGVIIIAVPHYARHEILKKICPFVSKETWVGSFPGFGGFLWMARTILGEDIRLFGLQRVPFVCHKICYGDRVKVTGIRPRHFIAAQPVREVNKIAEILRQVMNLYIVPMPNYLNVCFSRSNSVFHPARIYSLFRDWKLKARPTLIKPLKFYAEWDDQATTIFGSLDAEMSSASKAIPLDLEYAQPLLQHYEIAFLSDLTHKIQSIQALSQRFVPLIRASDGFIPDLSSYYFTEDICYGLTVLKSIMALTGVTTPVTDSIIEWGQELLGLEFISRGQLIGKDTHGLPLPQNYGLTSLEELVQFCSM